MIAGIERRLGIAENLERTGFDRAGAVAQEIQSMRPWSGFATRRPVKAWKVKTSAVGVPALAVRVAVAGVAEDRVGLAVGIGVEIPGYDDGGGALGEGLSLRTISFAPSSRAALLTWSRCVLRKTSGGAPASKAKRRSCAERMQAVSQEAL